MADLTFEPWTFYNVTVTCHTASVADPADPDNPKPCPNYEREWVAHEVYSNDGQPNIQCGPCQQRVEMLAAEKMDPQPEIS